MTEHQIGLLVMTTADHSIGHLLLATTIGLLVVTTTGLIDVEEMTDVETTDMETMGAAEEDSGVKIRPSVRQAVATEEIVGSSSHRGVAVMEKVANSPTKEVPMRKGGHPVDRDLAMTMEDMTQEREITNAVASRKVKCVRPSVSEVLMRVPEIPIIKRVLLSLLLLHRGLEGAEVLTSTSQLGLLSRNSRWRTLNPQECLKKQQQQMHPISYPLLPVHPLLPLMQSQ